MSSMDSGAHVTVNPAPERKAPNVVKTAAPVIPFEPATINTFPCRCLYVSVSTSKSMFAIVSFSILLHLIPVNSFTISGKPISTDCISPECV